jgi:predicted O-methyltransferase YrrM
MEEFRMYVPEEIDEDYKDLYQMVLAPSKRDLMMAGIELKIFDQLSEPISADGVAEKIGSHSKNTEYLLNGLAAVDIVTKKDGLYQNTKKTQRFLVEGSPTYLGHLFNVWNKQFFAEHEELLNLVRNGPPPPSETADMGSEEMWAQLAHAMAAAEKAGMAREAAQIISGLPEFTSMTKMLDLGGGPGLLGMAIVSAHQNMMGVIYDRQAVVNVAQEYIKSYDLQDRMDVMAGDYNTDSIGEGYDLIWASNSLYFMQDNAEELMKKMYDALNPGGLFVVYHPGLTHERTKPGLMVVSMTLMNLRGQDMTVDQGEIANAMLKAGFKSVRSRTMDTTFGPMELDIGRK